MSFFDGKHPLYHHSENNPMFEITSENEFKITNANQGAIQRNGLDYDQSSMIIGPIPKDSFLNRKTDD